MHRNKKFLVYGLVFSAGLGFLLFKSITDRTSLSSNTMIGTVGHRMLASEPKGNTEPSAHQETNTPQANLAPDFTLQTPDGRTVRLSDYRGKKPVILDFWASWCHNCQRSMPKLSRWYDQYKDHVEVIGVNLAEEKGAVVGYINKANISFPVVLDPGGVANLYGIRYTNTHYLIDIEGRLVRQVPGNLRESDITSLIQ